MEKSKVGVIVNTHALKGELKIKSFSDFNATRFAKGARLYISYHNDMIEVCVKTYREAKGLVYVSFAGLQDINAVEKYKGCEVYVDKSDLHELEEDEVYFSDLMHCEVYDEEEHLLGVVEDVLETGANAVLRVNHKILIPYVKAFIKDVDIKAKRIVIHKVEGLL